MEGRHQKGSPKRFQSQTNTCLQEAPVNRFLCCCDPQPSSDTLTQLTRILFNARRNVIHEKYCNSTNKGLFINDIIFFLKISPTPTLSLVISSSLYVVRVIFWLTPSPHKKMTSLSAAPYNS